MGGLVKKPRVFWVPGHDVWGCIGGGTEMYSGVSIIAVCKKWFDEVYGKGNHAYH